MAKFSRKLKRGRVTGKLPLFGMSKVILSGLIGGNKPTSAIGQSVVGSPNQGCTQTFITIGKFDNQQEAENCNKYINTKFVQAMLSIKKVTQHNTPATWEYVPMQDFTDASDIDWSKSLADIDRQLYRKYKLDWREIAFIETNFKYWGDSRGMSNKIIKSKAVIYTKDGVKVIDSADNYKEPHLLIGKGNVDNLVAYTQSKFFRLMLDLMRLAQWEPINAANSPFKPAPIDWDKPLDEQFYRLCDFTPAMIQFVEGRYHDDL